MNLLCAACAAINSLAVLLHHLGQFDEAEALYREAAELGERTLGPEHPDTLTARANVASVLRSRGDTAAATLLATTYQSVKQVFGDSHPRTGAAAEVLFQNLLATCARALGEDDQTTIIATNSYAVLLMSQERYAHAEPYLERALAVGRRVEGEEHQNTIITELNDVSALREMGRLDDAAALGPGSIERFERVLGARHPNTAVAHSSYAQTRIKLHRDDEAQRHLQAAIDIHKQATGEQNPTFASDALRLARLLIDSGRLADAEPVLHEIDAAYSRARGADCRPVAEARIELGRCRWQQRRFAEAEPLLLAGLPVLEKLLPVSLREVQRVERYLAEFYAAWNSAEPDAARAARAADWQRKAAARR